LPSRSGPAGRRSPRQRTLSREAIAAAALEIVDRDGLDALTMRAVADALATGAASLYAHVASKEELLELVVERVIGEIPTPGELDPGRWQQQIKEWGRAVRTVYSRHRDVARASFARIPLGENSLRGSETLIALMRSAGLAEQVVAFACDLLPLYVMAVCYEESLYASEISPEEMDRYVTELRTYFESLPTDRFPNLVAMAGPLTSGVGDDRFEFGLEVLVRGLAALGGAGS
jgi:AcrR family transcriptional regulator